MLETIVLAAIVLVILNFAALVITRRRMSTSGLLRSEMVGDVLLSASELEQHAKDTAARHRLVDNPRAVGMRLPSPEQAEEILLRAYQELSEAARDRYHLSPAAEWFLDNFYVIQSAARDIRRSLPRGYYRQLPKLANGPLRGYPRVYAIAMEIVSHTDGRLEQETIANFVNAYQEIAPLTIGELWAIPIFLRVALIENLKNLSQQLIRAHRQRLKADAWVEKILQEVDRNDDLDDLLARQGRRLGRVDSVFAVQVLHLLRNQGSAVAPIISWFEEKLLAQGASADDTVHLEHQRQSSREVSIANSVTTLRTLASADWEEFFERLNRVERTLRTDPDGTYPAMDFASRDRYRHAVERIARRLRVSEVQVARQAVECARKAGEDAPSRKRHVGYYLIDEGRGKLLASLGYRPGLWARLRRGLAARPIGPYLSVIAAGTAAVVALLVRYAWEHAPGSTGLLVAVAAIATIPASDLVVRVINAIITRIIKPQVIPKLELREGIPEELRTAVVIPALIPSRQRAAELVEQLEIHYLANQEDNLFFVLLGDFKDSDRQVLPEDEEIVSTASEGVKRLNEKYCPEGKPIFHFLWRQRQWNERQKRWMGWERKRGALVEFNRLLRSDQTTTFVEPRLPDEFKQVKYVITLDADTQLPRDAARRLIGGIAHPLNQAVISKKLRRVITGYGLLQPRIGVAITSASRSLFAFTFSGQSGVDPYTTAVSDIYQDVFNTGIFTGKGIYDVDAFYQLLDDRFPENAILSHDLLEGSYVRTGLATDIILVDSYPTRYDAYAKRLHRWVRGDWQLLPWLSAVVSTGRGERERNPLSLLARWQIFDNLRRSLIPVSMVALLTGAVTVFPGSNLLWLGFALLVATLPIVTHLANAVMSKPRGISFVGYLATSFADAERLLWHTMLSLAFLPHQAYLMVDAITRTLVRMYVTRRNLLEWLTAADAEARLGKGFWGFVGLMWPAEPVTAGFAGAVWLTGGEWALAMPFIVLWALSPALAYRLSQPTEEVRQQLSAEQKQYLRLQARRIWAYFEDFVGPEDNWLPPDNYQVEPRTGVAHRTSPTNIGLMLASTLAARDLGYVTTSDVVQRLEQTFSTLERMERVRGHFYNWYSTRTLKPLEPLYLSTVDSGNLVGSLIAVRQGLADSLEEPVVDWSALASGLRDTLQLATEGWREKRDRREEVILGQLGRSEPSQASCATLRRLQLLDELAVRLGHLLESDRLPGNGDDEGQEAKKWFRHLQGMIDSTKQVVENFMPWARVLAEMPEQVPEKVQEQTAALARTLEESSPLALMHTGRSAQLEIERMRRELQGSGPNAAILEWADRFAAAVSSAIRAARELVVKTERLMDSASRLVFETDFQMLYDSKRHLFSIGYNMEENKLTGSYYDLLASEARLASFVAIAKGDAPQKHWFRLGRTLTPVGESRALASWSGTMFEYLMPLLLMKSYDQTLLADTYKAVVREQMRYGKQRHVPWGISECAFNALDLHLTYQYQGFGVPGLGLRRGLARDLVIAPYATFMALMVDPAASYQNLKALEAEGCAGTYGMYEAIDYTRERVPRGANGAVVQTFMVHHLGMSLLGLDNYLNDNIMQKRFHSDPYIKATELLLQERIPQGAIQVDAKEEEGTLARRRRRSEALRTRVFGFNDLDEVDVHLNSNGEYSLMLTTSGTGYSRWKNLAVTRWREDRTTDNYGTFFYIKDLRDQSVWSATYHPTMVEPDEYEVEFSEDKAEFTRKDGDIVTRTEVSVSSEHNVEVRRVSLTNHGKDSRLLEVTSYLEVVGIDGSADAAHPAFTNLFVQTEYVEPHNALIAVRRPRGESQEKVWMMHTLAVDGEAVGDVEYETDRFRFLGRDQTVRDPLAVRSQGKLSGTVGAVLEPVFCLRRRVRIAPGKTVRLVYSTGIASSREEILDLTEIYHDPEAAQRTFALAWTRSQVELRYLNLTYGGANLFQALASRLLFPDPEIQRKREDLKKANTKGQKALWAQGISGDFPIMLIKVKNLEEHEIVKQALTAHEYWRMKGLKVDLIILNEHEGGYAQEVQEFLRNLITSSSAKGYENQPGGVFLKQASVLAKEDVVLLESVARVVFSGGDGPLQLQLGERRERRVLPPQLAPTVAPASHAPGPLPVGELAYFNGFGGFSKDGREYVIILEEGKYTPAPWLNVVCNERFGFQVTEAGSGFTWAANSQENKLTPWSNDPVSDPPGEVIYLRDDITGEVWTPTPLPIRGPEHYVIHHGQGYSRFRHHSHGIDQDLMMFVPRHEPVKISRLRLRNDSGRERTLSIFYYVEWVLGQLRERNQQHVWTKFDQELDVLLAYNRYADDYADRVAFMACNLPGISVTGNREEFIGRHGSLAAPEATGRVGLSGDTGPGIDPCGALHNSFQLQPGQQVEIIFLLGEGESLEEVRQILDKYRQREKTEQELQAVIAFWDDILGTIQVRSANLALNLMVNRWLLYQNLACRVWARSAFYQSGGAYGFRDQLQDVMALLVTRPQIAREHILRAASHQFVEGDVQHWWHPNTTRGIRTRFSDDFLWLPLVTAKYVEVTGDLGILDEEVPFLEDEPLDSETHERYGEAGWSEERASLYEHCLRAINWGMKYGEHGLPLMGTGDWNDGMNKVGWQGSGESVWVAWFQITVFTRFAHLCQLRQDEENAVWLRKEADRLKNAIEETAWDGEWYRRAYFDDGTPLGSTENDECKIDSIAQSWSVISGAGDPERSEAALRAVEDYLVREEDGLILLLAPPFDKTNLDPGYIKGYVPGVRENGGQYTHAATWVILANALLGRGDRALQLLDLINPVNHSTTPHEAIKYRVEPYVVAADVYAVYPNTGRGGWTWYTGAAGWMYQVALEAILGFRLQGHYFTVDPCIPADWERYELQYRKGRTAFEIVVENPEGVNCGVKAVYLDNKTVPGKTIPLLDDGQKHLVRVVMGAPARVETEGAPADPVEVR